MNPAGTQVKHNVNSTIRPRLETFYDRKQEEKGIVVRKCEYSLGITCRPKGLDDQF